MKNTTRPKFSTMKEYKEAIVRVLVGPAKASTKIKPQTNFHYLCTIPATEKRKTPTRTCKRCSTKENRKESRYQCLKCPGQPALCIDQCFCLYHKIPVLMNKGQLKMVNVYH